MVEGYRRWKGKPAPLRNHFRDTDKPMEVSSGEDLGNRGDQCRSLVNPLHLT